METYMDFFSNSIFSHVIAPLFLLLILQYINNRQQKYGKTTTRFHPYGGTKLHQLINYTTLYHYMTDLASKHKTSRIYNPFHTEVYTVDPANLEYILKTNFENYGKGPYIYDMMNDLLGDGIFTVDGNKWREQRKDLFMKTTTDSIFKVGFGIDLDIMSGTKEEGIIFSRAFDDANTLTIERFIDKSWKIKKFLNIGSETKLKKNVEVIDEFVYKVIQMKIEQMHKLEEEFSLKKEDILSRFVQINDNDPKYLRDIILNYVLAGKDPIAISLSWLIYMLCKHPEMQDKVAKEIKEATNVSEEITYVEDFVALL
ncbi:cytochrome P450 [Artemisia annua]|uniref:Cytochrome P450 n=1 Tax=Artemisia annua TaxID=35608 RepID=A0A2U1MA62_ARTAN|nr:cytochrome P450 [Artemisia annua]